ncbi:uncharacterized protein LOC119609783 isoform X2 [Lucilia sericata]|uniref:uncharacterized protein LOC119609783 isoform X2 n=1 Tax=Lucilia sericata TaxID=13632 RepID=UPI0018A80861|nr:uncharacterized protein LOC119609783 isoform X2 [Lucilia sericata]
MLSSNAILTDWDGQINVLERQDLPLLYRGAARENQEDSLNNLQTNSKHLGNISRENSIEKQRNIHKTISTDNHNNIVDDRDASIYGAISESLTGRHECHDNISRASSSRFGSIYQQVAAGSSMLADSITEIMVLRPYVAILSLVGLNPISTDTTRCKAYLSYLQCTILIIILLFGYFLQYLSAYRGDRGFSTNTKNVESIDESKDDSAYTIGELLFGFIIPCSLDLAGYVSAVIICKFIDHEQLQNLIERTFLMSMQPKKLFRTFWLHIVGAFVLCCCLYAYFIPVVILQSPIIPYKWFGDLETIWQLFVKVALLITLSVQNLIEIIILSSYCIECYLLKVHLLTLSQKLLLHSIESADWMREILQFRKLLERLNNNVSLPVSFFVIMNMAYAFAGFVYMFKDFDFHYCAMKTVILNFTNVLLWLILGLLPFFIAASLTQACQSVRNNGHQIRVRPFVYHNTSTEDLNSMLIFSSTLDMSAKLFRMPIQSNYICFAVLIISIVILTLGMCFNLSIFGIPKL